MKNGYLGSMARFVFVVAALAAASLQVVAQESVITANPALVGLREIWRFYGDSAHLEGGWIESCAGIPDVDGGGIDEIGIQFMYASGQSGPTDLWLIFPGGSPEPGRVPIDRSMQGYSPVTGNFWGGGGQGVAAFTADCSQPPQFKYCPGDLVVYRARAERLEQVWSRGDSFFCGVYTAADLDSDGDDELIVTAPCYVVSGLWVYRGGADFPGDAPALRLPNPDDLHGIVAGDFDGDRRTDIVTLGTGAGQRQSLKFYFGSATSPWSWTGPDRDVEVPDSRAIDAADVDGDGVTDLLLYRRSALDVYLFRSGRPGPNCRSRSYQIPDVDQYWPSSAVFPAGHLNDSSRRCESIMLIESDSCMLFSGGANGPDLAYDAFYENRETMGVVRPVGDVSGDGWEDVVLSSRSFNVAIVLAGGPYIPRPDTTLGVHDVEIDGKERGLSFWPNPVRDELNIAWRGDLPRMPRRFVVHDELGRRVAAGDVEPEIGAALWRCADAPAGAYVLTVYDAVGGPIASERIIKK